MFDAYMVLRGEGWGQRAAAEQIAAQYSYRNEPEIRDIAEKMKRLEEREQPPSDRTQSEEATV